MHHWIGIASLDCINAHPRDSRICFFEEDHLYFLDKKIQFPLSVSGVWQQFFEQFDADGTIYKYFSKWACDPASKYYDIIMQSRNDGKDDETIMSHIKNQWFVTGQQASKRGTYMHKQIELCLNAREFDHTMPEMEQFFEFAEECMLVRKWKPWRTEWSIYDEHLMVAGQIDSIFEDDKGKLHMVDWKRVKHNLDRDDKRCWNRYGSYPLEDFVDNHWSHYAAQQNLYATILADNYGIHITSMSLVQLHQDRQKYVMHPLPFFLEEARIMLCRSCRTPEQIVTTPRILHSVAFLDAYGEEHAAVVDNQVVQLDYIEVEPPGPGVDVLAKDNERILNKDCRVMDFTGKREGIRITEKAALSLAGFDSQDHVPNSTFRDLAKTGMLQFPLLASISVHLQVKEAKSLDGVDDPAIMNFTIVEAAEQDITEEPNSSFVSFIKHMQEFHPSTDGLIAASLSTIQKSEYYHLQVRIGEHVRPCHKVLVLVISTQRTTQESMDGDSLRLTTEGVIEGAIEGVSESGRDKKYTLVGMCSKNSFKDAVLDPPRSGNKQQAALAVVTGVLDEHTFLLQNVRRLTEKELPRAKKLMQELIIPRESQPEWRDDGTCPPKLKYRKLGG